MTSLSLDEQLNEIEHMLDSSQIEKAQQALKVLEVRALIHIADNTYSIFRVLERIAKSLQVQEMKI